VKELYNPEIKALLTQAKDDWGDPEENRTRLVPYGISIFDQYLYGIDVINGELILVMGREKHRKTTFAINVVLNYMTYEGLQDKPVTVIDTLESGMPPTRYRDQMIANLASRWLIEEGHFPKGNCAECGAERCRNLVLTPEYLRFNTRSPAQKLAIDYAMDTMSSWPLFLFGASYRQGGTRDLYTSVQGGRKSLESWQYLWAKQEEQNGLGFPLQKAITMSRWDFLIREFGAKLFVADHIQQYSFANEPSDYEKQLRAVSAISDFVASQNIAAFVLSQVSLTSVRESRGGQGRLGAMGGSKIAQEANVALSTHYNPDAPGVMSISIEESRKSGTFHVLQRLDDKSGAYYGTAEIRWKRIDLRQVTDDDDNDK
jgi:hypothetical protein